MATAIPMAPNRTASEARRPGSGSRAGGVSRAERGNDGSPIRGETPQAARCATHDSATGHVFLAGDAQTYLDASRMNNHALGQPVNAQPAHTL